jgi:hypothetical protein
MIFGRILGVWNILWEEVGSTIARRGLVDPKLRRFIQYGLIWKIFGFANRNLAWILTMSGYLKSPSSPASQNL